jgi:3-hydroxyisobutyrate dehydrogenase
MADISFLGLGKMGVAMASHLLRRGHRLNIYNRTAARAKPLADSGARIFGTPREACHGAGVIISMVADDNASAAMWCGRDGALAADLRQNAFAIECSTLSHAWVKDLSAQCLAAGLRYVDAPVTGLPEAAASGQLTLLVGAREQDLAAIRPILADLATQILRFGPVGAGTVYKLIINLLGAVQIASAAESLALAERAGLEMSVVAEAIGISQAASPQVVRNVGRMIAADHDQNIVFTSALRQKDVGYALRLARELNVGTPFGAVANDIYRQLCDIGRGQVNESSVIEVLRAQASKTRN